MAKLALPGEPHPSLLRCDLFFLAGDPATLCPKTEVLDQYGSFPSLHLTTQFFSQKPFVALKEKTWFLLKHHNCAALLYVACFALAYALKQAHIALYFSNELALEWILHLQTRSLEMNSLARLHDSPS